MEKQSKVYIEGTTSEQIIKAIGGRMESRTKNQLFYHDALALEITDGQFTFADLLNVGVQKGISVVTTTKQTGYSQKFLTRVYRAIGLPILPRAQAAAAAKSKQWREDPGFRERQAAAVKEKWKNQAFRDKITAASSAKWQNPQFRERNRRGVSVAQKARWKDPKVREMMDEKWKDSEFRAKIANAIRATRAKVENQGRYHYPTIYGERRDIGYAYSAWEANIARVLQLLGREVITHETFKLSDGSQLEIDFVTVRPKDPFNRITAYEIMAHPFENPLGWRKLIQAQNEYPSITIKPITQKFYKRLARRFRDRINSDPQFCGWESSGDNLRTNPSKYDRKIAVGEQK